VIDHGSVGNVIPDQPTDVNMKWTRTRKHQSHSQTPPLLVDKPSSSIASGSGTRNNSRVRTSTPPIVSTQNSRSKDHPPTLPLSSSDAVDLVVEDSQAAEEEHIHDRRKGETTTRPLVSSHLKKVYHRGGGMDGVGVGEVIRDGEDDDDGNTDDEPDVSRPGDRSDATRDTGVIARAVTPPLHARVHYDDIHDNDNPWA